MLIVLVIVAVARLQGL